MQHLTLYEEQVRNLEMPRKGNKRMEQIDIMTE